MNKELKKLFPNGMINIRGQNDFAVTWISAMLPLGKGSWEQRIFKTEEIRHIAAIDPSTSRVTLYDDMTFLVRMDMNALWQKIFVPDFRNSGEPISLLSVTGATAFPEPLPSGTPEIGEKVEGEGVYIGQYTPATGSGITLGKIFNVYAAPVDFSDGASVNEVRAALGKLKSWHGYDGINYSDHDQLVADLAAGRYKGEWIIPPLAIVKGPSQGASFLHHQNAGALKGTFNAAYRYMALKIGSDYPAVKMQDGDKTTLDPTYKSERACRLVRLVEVNA